MADNDIAKSHLKEIVVVIILLWIFWYSSGAKPVSTPNQPFVTGSDSGAK
ncbi:MAG: hypothetical protein NTZ44_01330 [Candidatus Nomurabacteria bacterium]|nr:hypothetical protein [Candidatus Nomurabacteria bacterium]